MICLGHENQRGENMNDIVLKSEEKIENLIYEIRGKQVMLDRDLAKLYKTETRVLIQKLKRNIERFPEEFCFQLNQKEFLNWRSQNVMSHNDKIGLRRHHMFLLNKALQCYQLF